MLLLELELSNLQKKGVNANMTSQDYLMGLKVRGHRITTGTDDGAGAADFARDVEDTLDETLSEWDKNDESYTYLQDMKENLDEFSNHLEFDPVHVASYCVEIVTGLLGMLFGGFKLMFENMRPTPKYNENSGSDWNYDSATSGRVKEKTHARKKEKTNEMEQEKTRLKRKTKDFSEKSASFSSEKYDLTARRNEQSHRAAFVAQARRYDNLNNYNKSVERRASVAFQRENGKEMANEMAMSRF